MLSEYPLSALRVLSGLSQCSLDSLSALWPLWDCLGLIPRGPLAWNRGPERPCRDPTCDSWRFGDLRPQICVTVDENAPGARASAALASDPLPQHVGEQPPLRESTQLPQITVAFAAVIMYGSDADVY